MVENFVPQPYPLECSADGIVWSLVLGWQRVSEDRLSPLVAPADATPFAAGNPQDLRYRVAVGRPSVTSVRPSMAPSRSSRS